MKGILLTIVVVAMFVMIAHMMRTLDLQIGEKRRKRKKLRTSKIYAGTEERKTGE